MKRTPEVRSSDSREISRGEFLATAGALAGGAAAGFPARDATARVSGGAPHASHPGVLRAPPYEWAIPAGVLNALWSDVFPRLVAKSWLADPADPNAYHWVWPYMTEADLIESLWTLHEELGGRRPRASHPTEAQRVNPMDRFGARSFQADAGVPVVTRVQRIAEFFTLEHSPRFFIAGSGGYDFLLSDWGIEFFFPEKPKTAAELLRYYTFRRTGRPSIGLPLYMESGMASVSTDAPTGPSQARGSLRAAEARWGTDSLIASRNLDRPATLQLLLEEPPLPPQIADTLIPLSDYQCGLAQLGSAWQVEGAVYRGIMNELPRAVATGWMEIQNRTNSGLDAYAPRIWDDNVCEDPEHGFRSIFKERLETSLPEKMAFGFHPTSTPDSLNGVWDADDAMITNEGFFFPKPHEPSRDNLDHTFRDRLITEIAGGRAGNPVFTDSKRTQT